MDEVRAIIRVALTQSPTPILFFHFNSVHLIGTKSLFSLGSESSELSDLSSISLSEDKESSIIPFLILSPKLWNKILINQIFIYIYICNKNHKYGSTSDLSQAKS